MSASIAIRSSAYILVLFLVTGLIPAVTVAQTFMPAFMHSLGYTEGYIQLSDGNKIEGTFTAINHLENIKSLTIKEESGQKNKLGEDQIDKVFIKFRDIDKFSTANESLSSIKAMSNVNFDQIFKADYFIWEHAITPKKGKREILQLVNPGFDTKIKVYRDPVAKETSGLSLGGMAITGGIEKSYYLVKAGEDIAIHMKKGDYKKQFAEIFGDCPEFIEAFQDNYKPDWDDLAAHVFAYDQLCK